MFKKPIYDYRGLSIHNLSDPRFSHLKLLGGWIFYFAMYFLTENLIPFEKCHIVHSRLDDMIPFNEYFAIFYVFWYVLVFGTLLYTLLYNVPNFKKVQTFIIITQVVAMACYIIWPTMQDLRPEVFPRDNFLTDVMKFIYGFDTPTGVSPSLHVAYSLGILSVGLKDKDLSGFLKVLLTFLVIMICLATCFVKQHSIIDVFTAIPVGILAEAIVYGKDYWLPKFKKSKA